ncbi:MAG TPA: hypothetical protein DEP33_02130, partial [Alteromonas sp.]|nr:hypothetical protein [Alteromonas sp.]
WEPIIDMLSFRDVFYDLYKEADEKSVIKFMVTDTANPGSIINCLAAVRENARIIREIIPSEAWEQINNLYIAAKADGQSVLTRRHRFNCLHRIIVANQTITGLLGGTMLRGEGYAFLRLGRHLERTDMTSRIIDVRSASLLPDLSPEQSAFENIQWMGVLKSLTAYQMYRQEMRIRINRADVLEFLINNRQFPRSLQHGLMQIGKCLLELPNSDSISQQVEALSEELQQLDTHELTQDRLHEVIDDIQLGVVKLHQAIDSQYF